MTLVIMAAGMGSRFGGLKQIESMNSDGEFIIDYSIHDAVEAGFDKVVFIIKKENYEIFKETIGKRIQEKVLVEYVFQEQNMLPERFNCPKDRVKPWGTAHAILCARKAVKEPFLIINSDDFYGKEAFKVAYEYLCNIKNETDKMHSAIVGYKLINTVSTNGSVKRGVCEIKDNKLVKLTESKIELVNGKYIAYPLDGKKQFETNDDTIVSMNMIAFTDEIFNFLEENFVKFLEKNINNINSEFLIPDVILDLINRNLLEVDVLKTNAKWLGVTYREDKEYVVSEIGKLHSTGVYNKHLWD